MNRADVLRFAQAAGLSVTPPRSGRYNGGALGGDVVSLKRFAALVAAAEREACAKVCESTPWTTDLDWWRKAIKREVAERSSHECAAAIRARGAS